VSFFFISLIMFIQYSSNLYQSMRITRWLMGGLFVYGYKPIFDLLPFIIIGLGGIWMYTHELNLLTTGEELAASRGVDVRRTVKALFVLISLAIAKEFLEAISKFDAPKYDFEIHLDIGQNGATKVMIQELVGMVRAHNFEAKTKPDSYAATNVADKHV